jgi:hypothetical protein
VWAAITKKKSYLSQTSQFRKMSQLCRLVVHLGLDHVSVQLMAHWLFCSFADDIILASIELWPFRLSTLLFFISRVHCPFALTNIFPLCSSYLFVRLHHGRRLCLFFTCITGSLGSFFFWFCTNNFISLLYSLPA